VVKALGFAVWEKYPPKLYKIESAFELKKI
jgi:hypothetical protein